MEGCALDDLENVSNIDDGSTVWVFTQFNVPEENNAIDSYWYFGEVSQALYNKISSNTVGQGFIGMKNVRYWGSEGKSIYEYADEEHSGDLVFRIEDIRRIKLLKMPPKVGGSQASESEEVQDLEEE